MWANKYQLMHYSKVYIKNVYKPLHMFRRAGRHLQGVVHWCKVHLDVHMLIWCVQCLHDRISSTFNVILTYGRLSGPYTNERPPEDGDLLVETYVGDYIQF
jgi:hypothetical protein